ncbi:MAG TPA: hypothetical protein VD948_12995 [Rhodothermales bacterium]|nr:hypothetical protein [Rhodothermales bacterium]
MPIPCRKFTVRPDLNAITGGWRAYAPHSSANYFQVAEGEAFSFDAGPGNVWQAGAVVGYARTENAGPFTFYGKCE